jgi:hypothetical protein
MGAGPKRPCSRSERAGGERFAAEEEHDGAEDTTDRGVRMVGILEQLGPVITRKDMRRIEQR